MSTPAAHLNLRPHARGPRAASGRARHLVRRRRSPKFGPFVRAHRLDRIVLQVDNFGARRLARPRWRRFAAARPRGGWDGFGRPVAGALLHDEVIIVALFALLDWRQLVERIANRSVVHEGGVLTRDLLRRRPLVDARVADGLR